MAEIDLGAVVGPRGDTGSKGEKGDQGPQGPQGPSGVVDGNSTISFTTPTTYEEPVSGNSISVLFGRFKRWVLNLQDNIGSLSSLKTPAKASVVDGVNANYDTIAQMESDVGNPTDLTTDAKEIVGAVNELNSALDKISSTTSITPRGSSTITSQFVARSASAVRVELIETVASLTKGTPQRIATLTDTNFFPSVDVMKFIKLNSTINGAIRIYANGDIYITPDATMQNLSIYIDETFIV